MAYSNHLALISVRLYILVYFHQEFRAVTQRLFTDILGTGMLVLIYRHTNYKCKQKFWEFLNISFQPYKWVRLSPRSTTLIYFPLSYFHVWLPYFFFNFWLSKRHFFSLDVESARIFKQKQLILSNIIIAFILTHSWFQSYSAQYEMVEMFKINMDFTFPGNSKLVKYSIWAIHHK